MSLAEPYPLVISSVSVFYFLKLSYLINVFLLLSSLLKVVLVIYCVWSLLPILLADKLLIVINNFFSPRTCVFLIIFCMRVFMVGPELCSSKFCTVAQWILWNTPHVFSCSTFRIKIITLAYPSSSWSHIKQGMSCFSNLWICPLDNSVCLSAEVIETILK